VDIYAEFPVAKYLVYLLRHLSFTICSIAEIFCGDIVELLKTCAYHWLLCLDYSTSVACDSNALILCIWNVLDDTLVSCRPSYITFITAISHKSVKPSVVRARVKIKGFSIQAHVKQIRCIASSNSFQYHRTALGRVFHHSYKHIQFHKTNYSYMRSNHNIM
jgi:hypothetical protein